MGTTTRILAFAGSTREESLNKKLMREAVRLGEAAGRSFTAIDLRDYAMPLYDGDLEKEKGLPEKAMALKKLIQDHDALLIASPEYNNSVTGVLKNTIDWLSRPNSEGDPGDVLTGKVVAIIGASPGRFGAYTSAQHLRTILRSIDVLVIPAQCSVAGASKAFDEDGQLTDERAQKALKGVVNQLEQTARALG